MPYSNDLFVKLSDDSIIAVNAETTYLEENASLVAESVLDYFEGKTVDDYVLAEIAGVKSHCVTYSKELSDLDINEKQSVPGGDVMFTKSGVDLDDLGPTDKVLHCATT